MIRPKGLNQTKNEQQKNDAVELSSQGKASLIASIAADAQAEEEKILQEAAEQATQREQYTDKKIEMMLNEARQKSDSARRNHSQQGHVAGGTGNQTSSSARP